jgi:outer membrane protein OmpA-like peptidoglycan-associated protein
LCEPRTASGVRDGDNAFRNLVARPAPKVDLTVEFDFGKATLRPDGAAQLDALAVALNEPSFASNQFVLTGHTDAVGSADANDRLSCERALAAKRYLLDRHHIAAQRLVLVGMGFSQPINRSDPRAAVNRRVEVKLLAVN